MVKDLLRTYIGFYFTPRERKESQPSTMKSEKPGFSLSCFGFSLSCFGFKTLFQTAPSTTPRRHYSAGRKTRTLYTKTFGHKEWVTCVTHAPDGRCISGEASHLRRGLFLIHLVVNLL